MKLVDRMKDEELGTAILYNFTKGYGKPVPLELYDVVLPLLYHDFIREHVLTYTSLQECLYQCIQNEKHFKQHLLEKIEDDKTMTSKALGVAMIQHILKFEIVDTVMCGVALPTDILDLNEAIWLGKLFQDVSLEDFMTLLKQEDTHIVVLQSASVGKDVDLSKIASLGQVTMYEDTKPSEIKGRILGADIVITNKNEMTKEVLEGLKHLKLICLFATGTNNVDLEYCRDHGIKVANVKDYSTKTVAQHTLA